VLNDDPELYRAWVETADDRNVDARVQRLQKLARISTPGRILHRRGRSRESEPPASAADERLDLPALSMESFSAGMVESPLVVRESARSYRPTWTVPLLPTGAYPGRPSRPSDAAAETIEIDRQFLPKDQRQDELFAYRVTERTTERISNLVQPGDVLIFATYPEAVDPAAIYAVRDAKRIVLSRIVHTPPTLLLLGADPYQEPIQLDAGDESGLSRLLVGVVVAGLRSWAKPRRTEAKKTQMPYLGRSGRLEGGNIVRECEWKPNYGWRPVQKAEDMDYLEAHPGTTIQFELIREGEVKFVLEMSAEQWRGALGDYHDGPTWRRNGYIVAITRRVGGEYTEEFQERWAAYVTPA